MYSIPLVYYICFFTRCGKFLKTCFFEMYSPEPALCFCRISGVFANTHKHTSFNEGKRLLCRGQRISGKCF